MTTKAGTNRDYVGSYTQLPFPAAREVGIDTIRIGMILHHIPVLAELT